MNIRKKAHSNKALDWIKAGQFVGQNWNKGEGF